LIFCDSWRSGARRRSWYEKQDDGTVLTRARDNGTGIPAENLPKVFDRFFTTEPKDQPREYGSGLGLAIARSIIENHQGDIQVTRNRADRTKFTFRIPVTSGKAPATKHDTAYYVVLRVAQTAGCRLRLFFLPKPSAVQMFVGVVLGTAGVNPVPFEIPILRNGKITVIGEPLLRLLPAAIRASIAGGR